jgi:hypothetical protein
MRADASLRAPGVPRETAHKVDGAVQARKRVSQASSRSATESRYHRADDALCPWTAHKLQCKALVLLNLIDRDPAGMLRALS